MGDVTLHFSGEEFRIFHQYCTNYCRLYDETRKNSIRIFLELYKHQVIDIQEHSLENAFLFFYQKKQEFELACQIPGSEVQSHLRLRLCTDIIAFLEDLEKIYVLLRKKGIESNYFLILGTFLKITNDEVRQRREDLAATSAEEIKAIVDPLHGAIGTKYGQDADVRDILCELIRVATAISGSAQDLRISDDLLTLIGAPLIRAFGKEETDEDLSRLISSCRSRVETEDFEAALEGKPGAEGLGLSFDELEKPLRILNERFVQTQNIVRGSPDILAGIESPVRLPNILPGYSPVIPVQHSPPIMKRRDAENRFLIRVDDRPSSEVSITPSSLYPSVRPAQEDSYKQYFSIAAGAFILMMLVFAMMAFSAFPGMGGGNITNVSAAREMGGSVTGINENDAPTVAPTLDTTLASIPVPTIPTPTPVPQYVGIEPVPPEPDTGPQSVLVRFQKYTNLESFAYDPADYVTIYSNDMEYQEGNAYRISFDLKNPPMIIHYTVVPYNITTVKWFSPRDAAKLIDTATIVRPYENAWFRVKIYEDGSLVDEAGWGRDLAIPLTTQEIVVRGPGDYKIEFAGEYTKVRTEVLVQRQGNIAG